MLDYLNKNPLSLSKGQKIALLVVFLLLGVCVVASILIWTFVTFLSIWTYFSLSIILTSLALIITWNNYRLNNYVSVKIVSAKCSYCQSVYENNEHGFSSFMIVVKNLGIALHNPSVALDADSIHFYLSCFACDKRSHIEVGELKKGMIATFGIKSYEIKKELFKELTKSKNIAIAFYSDGYLVKKTTIPQHGLRLWLKRTWNSFAAKIEFGFSYEDGEYLRYLIQLPRFCDLAGNLDCMGEAIDKEVKQTI